MFLKIFLCLLLSSFMIAKEIDTSKDIEQEEAEDATALDWERVKPKEPPKMKPLTQEEIEEIQKESREKEKGDEKKDETSNFVFPEETEHFESEDA